jgi:hypothetical protein
VSVDEKIVASIQEFVSVRIPHFDMIIISLSQIKWKEKGSSGVLAEKSFEFNLFMQ